MMNAPTTIPRLFDVPPMMKAAHTRKVERAGDTDEGPQDSAVVDRAFHTPEELRELCDRDYHEDFFRWLASDRRRRYHLDRGRS